MRRVVQIGLGVFALMALFPFATFAAVAQEPVPSADLEAIFSVPAETPAPGQALPEETPIFLNAVDDALFNTCCRTASANCSASCELDVREFRCSRVGASGCSSYCACN